MIGQFTGIVLKAPLMAVIKIYSIILEQIMRKCYLFQILIFPAFLLALFQSSIPLFSLPYLELHTHNEHSDHL